MARPENTEIAAIENAAAALSDIRESIAILASRGRSKLNRDDLAELARIKAAIERIKGYHADLRNEASTRYKGHE